MSQKFLFISVLLMIFSLVFQHYSKCSLIFFLSFNLDFEWEGGKWMCSVTLTDPRVGYKFPLGRKFALFSISQHMPCVFAPSGYSINVCLIVDGWFQK